MAEAPLRPRDAATLIIVRHKSGRAEVLMGERSAKHVFVPHNYVFPGGRVDRADGYVEPAEPLRADVLERLSASATPRRAKAIALAAVRETFEETGLILGRPREAGEITKVPKGWEHFFETGMVPVLGGLTYVARAVTPTGRPRRFNARFFVVDAELLQGRERGNGELEELRWFSLEEAAALKIRPITKMVLAEIAARLEKGDLHDPERPVPAWRAFNGRRLVSYE